VPSSQAEMRFMQVATHSQISLWRGLSLLVSFRLFYFPSLERHFCAAQTPRRKPSGQALCRKLVDGYFLLFVSQQEY